MFPTSHEERVLLPMPLTVERLAEACKSCGFSKPVGSVDGMHFRTKASPSFLSLGEELDLELVTPIELVIRSTSVQTAPILGWGKSAGNVRKLVHALRGMPTGFGL
jgi:hypothetical protein